MLLLVVGLILSGCAQPSPAPAPEQPSTPAPEPKSWPKLTFFTPPSGTQPNTVAVAWSTLAGKYLPGMQILIEPAVGAPQAVVGFLQGNGDICYVASNIMGNEFPKQHGGKTLAVGPQHLVTGAGSAVHVLARADSGITSVADFKGKKIIGKVATGGATDNARRQMLATYGLTDDDIVLMSGNNGSHNAEQLKEGVGDAAFFILGIRDASVIELCTTKDIRWLDIPQDKMETIAEKTWLSPGTIPAGTYPKQDKPVLALRSPGSFDVQPSMSEDVAYALVKLYHEHFDEFVKMAPYAKDYSVEGSVEYAYLPFHPGAVKYYKEIGIWNSAAEAKQQKLLNRVIPARN